MNEDTSILINGLAVTYRLAAALKPHSSNPRTHSSKQIGSIMKSMRAYRWTNPILIDEEGNVLAGHAG